MRKCERGKRAVEKAKSNCAGVARKELCVFVQRTNGAVPIHIAFNKSSSKKKNRRNRRPLLKWIVPGSPSPFTTQQRDATSRALGEYASSWFAHQQLRTTQ